MAIPDETPEDWINTDNDQVFYRSQSDRWGRGEFVVGDFLADFFPDWTFLITMGPNRGYDIAYDLYRSEKIIRIDIYSAGLVSNWPTGRSLEYLPIVENAKWLLEELVEDIDDSEINPSP